MKKSFKIKEGDYCIYRYQVGSINQNKPLLCKVIRANPDFEINPIIIRSLESNEEFQINHNYTEFPFETLPVVYTIDEAKEKNLWKPVYDIALSKLKKGEDISELFNS